jgi:phosphoribosyl 1,2-cyclic phosphate phosphodiesterase
VLIDTSPDLRAQCLDANISSFDAVIYTHDHADHTHGIDELRPIVQRRRSPMPIFGRADAIESISRRFDYAFGGGAYPPIVAPNVIDGPFHVGDVAVTPFEQDHGGPISLGLRFGAIAYSTDLVALDEPAFAALAGVRVWIVDALRDKPHPTHAHVDLTLEWIARVRPERAILTHMTAGLDYATLAARLPAGVEPAHDGLVIELPDE